MRLSVVKYTSLCAGMMQAKTGMRKIYRVGLRPFSLFADPLLEATPSRLPYLCPFLILAPQDGLESLFSSDRDLSGLRAVSRRSTMLPGVRSVGRKEALASG